VLQTGMEVVPMIVIGLLLAAVAAVAFGAVVIGVQATDRHMRLRDSSDHGRADAFARKVLGVYVRQPQRRGRGQDATDDNCQMGRR
jgi:hypothetical protein